MAVGLVGRKCGMTRVFTPEGVSIPVTVIEITDNVVTQVKTLENDKYSAIQVTTGTCRHPNKPTVGHYAKAGVSVGRGLWEFRLDDEIHLSADQLTAGSKLTADMVFAEGQFVDVTGTTKGKGFAGTVKRYNFATQDATHGNSRSHRVLGSTGQNQSPGRVFKGKKMPGQMGNVTCTQQSLQIVKIDMEKNVLLVKGGTPGAPGGSVIVKPAEKKRVTGQVKEGTK